MATGFFFINSNCIFPYLQPFSNFWPTRLTFGLTFSTLGALSNRLQLFAHLTIFVAHFDFVTLSQLVAHLIRISDCFLYSLNTYHTFSHFCILFRSFSYFLLLSPNTSQPFLVRFGLNLVLINLKFSQEAIFAVDLIKSSRSNRVESIQLSRFDRKWLPDLILSCLDLN